MSKHSSGKITFPPAMYAEAAEMRSAAANAETQYECEVLEGEANLLIDRAEDRLDQLDQQGILVFWGPRFRRRRHAAYKL